MLEAYSTTSWTLPSHVAMLTGEPAVVHGVDMDHQLQSPELVPLPLMLKEAGYRTSGFYSAPYLEPHFGFSRGFDTYESHYGEGVGDAALVAAGARELRLALDEQGTGQALADARAEEAVADELHRELVRRTSSSAQITDAAIGEMEQAAREGRPFFLFAHYFDPHYDYVPPAPHDTLFDPDYQGAIPSDEFLINPAISLPDDRDPFLRKQVASERDMEHLRSLYAGELSWTDQQMGRLLTKLDELGLAEDTLVIVTADHGDEFFEHKSLGHRSTLFEEQVQVPMVLRWPGHLPAGVEVDGLVSTIDIVPTVAELLNLEPPHNSKADSFAGLANGDDSGDGRFVFGRIVRHTPGKMSLKQRGGEDVVVSATRFTLIETYREGAIKITRERSWPQLQQVLSPGLAKAFESRAKSMRERELLRWIDIERNPLERPREHVGKFKDPRAIRCLKHFQEHYRDLLARRSTAVFVESSARDSQLAALEALGYAGVDMGDGADLGDFVFPPPGE
jgi:hypothetical protein